MFVKIFAIFASIIAIGGFLLVIDMLQNIDCSVHLEDNDKKL